MWFDKLWGAVLRGSKKKNFIIFPRCPSYIFVKKVAFCPSLKSMPDFKMKNFVLYGQRKSPKQSSIDSAMQLSVATRIKNHNEKEQVEKRKMKNVQFEEKRSTRKWNGAKSCI